MTDLLEDTGLFAEAQAAARLLLDEDPALSQPGHTLLREKITRLFDKQEGGMN